MTYQFTSDEEAADAVKAAIRELKAASARQAEAEGQARASHPARGQSRSDSRKARLRAMRLGWERRGIPWDETRALAMLAEMEARGEVRTTRWPA